MKNPFYGELHADSWLLGNQQILQEVNNIDQEIAEHIIEFTIHK